MLVILRLLLLVLAGASVLGARQLTHHIGARPTPAAALVAHTD